MSEKKDQSSNKSILFNVSLVFCFAGICILSLASYVSLSLLNNPPPIREHLYYIVPYSLALGAITLYGKDLLLGYKAKSKVIQSILVTTLTSFAIICAIGVLLESNIFFSSSDQVIIKLCILLFFFPPFICFFKIIKTRIENQSREGIISL